jgi:DNA-binding transcriptional LysR family regulator
MEMRQIRYFRALSEELNFTRAAERCHVSQPSLTRAIKLLEEEFGGRLIHREGDKTHLSELGRIVKPHLDQIFEQAEVARRRASSFENLQQARLRLGVMCTIAPTLLVELVSSVRARHPGIHLEVADATAEQVDNKLQRGELEVAIACAFEEDQQNSRFHYLPLFREQFMIAIAPNHRLANVDAVRLKDLQKESYIHRVNCEVHERAVRVFTECGVSSETVYESDRDDWILAMVAAGMGYSFIPEQCVTHPRVVAKPLIEPEFWREIDLVTVRGRPHSPAVGALVREAMRATWMNDRALAVQRLVNQR